MRTIGGRNVDKEYEFQLRRHNKVIMIACLLSVTIGNIPLGFLALLCLFCSNRKYNRSQFLSGTVFDFILKFPRLKLITVQRFDKMFTCYNVLMFNQAHNMPIVIIV